MFSGMHKDVFRAAIKMFYGAAYWCFSGLHKDVLTGVHIDVV